MSLESCETVRVQREKSTDNPSGVVIINKSDFVEGEDELVEDEVVEVVKEPVKEPADDSGAATGGSKPWEAGGAK